MKKRKKSAFKHYTEADRDSLFLDVKVVIKVPEILIGSFVSHKLCFLWSYSQQEYFLFFFNYPNNFPPET